MSRKEELVSLYETHIAPVDREAGEFSSDDEVRMRLADVYIVNSA